MNQMMFLEEYQKVFQYQLTESSSDQKGFYIRGIVSRAGALNKNKRIYPIPVMEEAIRSIQEDVASGGFVGEVEHPCLKRDDFSVLTKTGWKDFKDIEIGEEVVSFNEENIIEYKPVIDIINEPFKGKVYNFRGRNINSEFTGPHKHILEDRYGKRVVATSKEIFDNRKKYSHHKIIKIGKWYSDSPEKFILKGIPEEQYSRKFKNDVREDLEIDLMAFMAFMGFYLSEGCISKEKYRISICQNEGIIADEFRDILKQLPFEVREYQIKRINNVIVTFNITDIRLHNYLKPLGNCYEKYIPLELKQMDTPYLDELLEWFIKGDGRDQKLYEGHERSNRRNVFSVSKRLIEDLHEISIKTGGSGNWTEITATEDYIFADHLIETKNKSTLYQLNLSTTKGIYLDERFLKIEEEDYEGNIYCISVKDNCNFYMKQDGKSFLTGNSSPKVNVDRISHKITKIEMAPDGAVLAEMVVLNTNFGRELKELMIGGVRLGVSTRALGGVKPMTNLGEGVVEVLPGLKLKAIDIVFDPSAGDDGRPNFVTESITDSGIILGYSKKFERIWGDVFGGN